MQIALADRRTCEASNSLQRRGLSPSRGLVVDSAPESAVELQNALGPISAYGNIPETASNARGCAANLPEEFGMWANRPDLSGSGTTENPFGDSSVHASVESKLLI